MNATQAPWAGTECEPLREEPPADRYCDLVLTGGVASGVVYPWAIVEIARQYRFKNVAGTSVGAIAAALAAASEYGRRTGAPHPFEVLRRVPLELAKVEGDEPKLLRLFQPVPAGQRLFKLLVFAVRKFYDPEKLPADGRPADSRSLGNSAQWIAIVRKAREIYELRPWRLLAWTAVVTVVLGMLRHANAGTPPSAVVTGALVLLGVALIVAAVAWEVCRFLRAIRDDFKFGIVDNDLGLCPGSAQRPQDPRDPTQEALVEWLHDGIQRAAGLDKADRPLTFADLARAPERPGAGVATPDTRSINLQMFTSNVTHGRPLRLPLDDPSLRLFYRESEWRKIFPPVVMAALKASSEPYRQKSLSDPDATSMADLYEIPRDELPIVVAARMSLSFPILFTAIPVWAIDFEDARNKRDEQFGNERAIRRCLLSDGGICSNFPIHLFDAALPRWPTFGMLLDRRRKQYAQQPVWLPEGHLEGMADNWQRFVPGAEDGPLPGPVGQLGGFLLGILSTAKDWNDRMVLRMPGARNRVVRLALLAGEGELNIAMGSSTILSMAERYGTAGGKALVQRFAPDAVTGRPARAWREHLYVRANTLIAALRDSLDGFGAAARCRAHSEPVAQVFDDGRRGRPLRQADNRKNEDDTGRKLDPAQSAALRDAIDAIGRLESALRDSDSAAPYQPVPRPELRVRPPI